MICELMGKTGLESTLRDVDLSKLTDPIKTREERIELLNQVFSNARKAERFGVADKDIKGRPVRYFRLMGVSEFLALIAKTQITYKDNPNLEAKLNNNIQQIITHLRKIINEHEKLDTREELLRELSDFGDNPSVDTIVKFIQERLSLLSMMRYHTTAGQGWSNLSGAISLSLGAPMMVPSDGELAVEMVIPSRKTNVIPPNLGSLRESEKEAVVLELDSDWIVDVYIDARDLATRYMANQESPLYEVFNEFKTESNFDPDAIDVLQTWKQREQVRDLVPAMKQDELELDKPRLANPLIS